MKLIEVTWQYRYDFQGILECEFCGSHQTLENGYDDLNFHQNVIPAIQCVKCEKRSSDESLPKISDPGTQGGVPVKLAEIKVQRWVRE